MRAIFVTIVANTNWVHVPTVMDLSRLVLAFCPTAYVDPALRSRFFAALFKGAGWNEPWSTPLPKPRETNLLFLFRSLANVFQDGTTLADGPWVQDVRLPPWLRHSDSI